MPGELTGKRVAILVADGFDEADLTHTRNVLKSAGARCTIVSPEIGRAKGWAPGPVRGSWATSEPIALALDQATADDFDALFVPGGILHADRLRQHADARRLIREFLASGLPVAALGHAPWLLIDAGVVEGCRVTSAPALRADLENAGAEWVDAPAVLDDGLLTGPGGAALVPFEGAMLAIFPLGRRPLGRRVRVVARVSGPAIVPPR